MPRRASLYARSPSIFTADAAGTTSSTGPRSRSSATSRSPRSGGSCCSTVSPSGSPVDVVAVRSTSVTYRLSSPTKHGASRVAAPDIRTSRPDANGSRVPACPVRARVRRRRVATIAKDDGPGGLSTSAMPTGRSARGGTRGRSHRTRRVSARDRDELAPQEVDDLVDLEVGAEACRLPVSAAARRACDGGDVDLVPARTQRDPACRAVGARRLADQRDHLRALDAPEVVDDPLRVRLLRADLGEVVLEQVAHDEPAALVDCRPLERASEQLELGELNGLVDEPEDAVDIGAGLDELCGEPQR